MNMDSSAEHELGDVDTHFLEVDPTGRYGRYKKILGKGAFKTVYWAFDKLEGREVAWNQVKVRDVSRGYGDLERLYAEVHLLKTLKHKNIIKFYNYWVDTDNKNINIITEIFTSGTLRQYRKRHKQVDVRAIKNWSRQILQGLLYLHSQDPPIIHRDLKCDNIFVNGGQGEVKIGDLGMAAILHQAHADAVIGTPEFMAPELYEEKYNELVDIYSFGMCLLEMMTFEYPYSECENAVHIYKKVSLGVKPAALDKVKDPCVRQFIEKCLETAAKRLSARELLMDPFLQNDVEDKSMDFSPLLSVGNEFKESKTSLEEPHMSGSFLKLSPSSEQYVSDRGSFKTLEELKFPCNSNAIVGASMPQESVVVNISALENHMEAGGSTSIAKEVFQANRDIRVKGTWKDDNTIFMRLRNADSEGYVRNIHFPFDIEADTAMIVASEMVEELGLSDQDVTTIAEMMDVEIAALMPEWKPGVSFDDTSGDHSHVVSEKNSSDSASDDDNPSSTFVLEYLTSGRKYWLQSPVRHAVNNPTRSATVKAPIQFPGPVHSGFKKVSCYQPSSSNVQDMSEKTNFPVESDWQGLLTNNLDTRDNLRHLKHSEMIDHTEKFPAITIDRDPSLSEIVNSTIIAESKNPSVRLQDSNIPERLEGTCGENLPTNNSESVNCPNKLEFSSHEGVEPTHTNCSAATFLEGTDNVRGPLLEKDKRIAQELEKLAIRQQRELEALRHKHKQALQGLRNQLRQKGCTGRNCFSETSELQQKLSIDSKASIEDESKSERLSLAEITAATAAVKATFCPKMHHRSSSGDDCIPSHKFQLQALYPRLNSVSLSRLGTNVNTHKKLPYNGFSTQQLPSLRPKLSGCESFSTADQTYPDGISSKTDTVGRSENTGPHVRMEDPSLLGEESETSSNSLSKRHSIAAVFSKKSLLKTLSNKETIIRKEMKNGSECKDVIRESEKNGSTLSFPSKDECNTQHVASSKNGTDAKERKQHAFAKPTGPSEILSLADLFKMEKESWKLEMSAAKKCIKQDTEGLQSERAETVFEESVPLSTNVSCGVETHGKTESHIKAYKNEVSHKDKPRSHQRDPKASDQGSSKSVPSELPKPRGSEKMHYQLKKRVFEKSASTSEAKTVNGLQRSNNSHTIRNSVKKQSITIPLVMSFHFLL